MDVEELKIRTKDFAHRCVKLKEENNQQSPIDNRQSQPEAHELASIFIVTRKTAQKNIKQT
jgi:hypothetical protein